MNLRDILICMILESYAPLRHRIEALSLVRHTLGNDIMYELNVSTYAG